MTCAGDWENNNHNKLISVTIHRQNKIVIFCFITSCMLLKIIKHAVNNVNKYSVWFYFIIK